MADKETKVVIELSSKDRALLKQVTKQLEGIHKELEQQNALAEVRTAVDVTWLRMNQEEDTDDECQTTLN